MSQQLQQQLDIRQRQVADFKQKGDFDSEKGRENFDKLMKSLSSLLRDTYIALKK
jgi:hypothetical protein